MLGMQIPSLLWGLQVSCVIAGSEGHAYTDTGITLPGFSEGLAAVEWCSRQESIRALLAWAGGVGSDVLTGVDNWPSVNADPAMSSLAVTPDSLLSFIISPLAGGVEEETFVSYSEGFIKNILIYHKPFPAPERISFETQS